MNTFSTIRALKGNRLNHNITDIPNCVLWLDAKDPFNNKSTTLPSNNTSVTKWFDKSGLNNHAIASTGVLWFSSSNDGLKMPAFYYNKNSTISTCFTSDPNQTFPIKNQITVFSVITMNHTGSTQGARIIGFSTNNTKNDYNDQGCIAFTRNLGSNGFGPQRLNMYLSNNPSSSNDSPFLTEMWADNNTLYATVQQGNSTTIVSRGVSDTMNINYYSIGCNTNNSSGIDTGSELNALIHEIVVYNTILTDFNRQRVEGYLSWKWGLQGNLPSSPAHPFYSSAPTF